MTGTIARTHDFKLEVKSTSPHETCDQLIEDCPGRVNTSGVLPGAAFIRFRARNDEEALMIARRTVTEDAEWSVSTGYGVHRREVTA